jgi:ABC-type Fe3+/spermidine/putrescine transport system ATPase subunit
MVFQDYALWPHMNARDNVAFALRRRKLPKAERQDRAMRLLDSVGLDGFAHRYPNELSGGQQQRVALARALIGDTGLILCDEPLSNLDADLRDRMRVEISSLVREAGATTVYITHDQAEAFALADQVGVLEEGQLVQAGTPEEIYNRPATPFVARFTGLAGEIRVRVSSHASEGGSVHVTAEGSAQAFAVAAGSVWGGALPGSAGPVVLAPGTEAVLAIRPTGVRLASVSGGDGHLTGKVTDVAFRGRGYEHAIDVPGHGRLTGIFSDTRAARGDQVGLRLEPSGVHLFPVQDGAAAACTMTQPGGDLSRRPEPTRNAGGPDRD